MINVVQKTKPVLIMPDLSDIGGLTAFVDNLLPEYEYTFKISSTVAGKVGLPSQYGFVIITIYSSQAAQIEFKSLLASSDIYKLRKYQGSWDGAWTRIKTTVVTE